MFEPVTAILVTYNSQKIVGQALASLQAEALIHRIIVVDNASQDKTCDWIRKSFPKVELIANPTNDGFGRGNNIALQKVETPYALLVNPDAVLSATCTYELIAAAKEYPDAAIFAPALYSERGELHKSFKRNVFHREQHRERYVAPEDNLCAEFLSGAVMLWNMSIMKDIGFFDPNIFLYYEDDDICLRVRQAGYGLVYVPSAKAMHLMGASGGAVNPKSESFRQQHMTWSRLYLEEKYQGRASALAMAHKLKRLYRVKATLYALQRNKKMRARYRGRLRGVKRFLTTSATMPTASRQSA